MSVFTLTKGNRCYSFSCGFPIRYVLSLKYANLQLLIQTSQLYKKSWHKLLKSKHCYFFNITYLHNYSFLLCEKLQKFEVHSSYSQKDLLEFSYVFLLIFMNMSIMIRKHGCLE